MNDNKGLVERKKYCAESFEIVLLGRPHVNLFYIDKLILPGIDVAIKFMPNENKFLFMSADGGILGLNGHDQKNDSERCN